MIFLDIGVHSINLDHIVLVHRSVNGPVCIEFDVLDGDGPATLTLYGEEANAFRAWWDRHRKLPELTIVGL